jgi:hypothetical protein
MKKEPAVYLKSVLPFLPFLFLINSAVCQDLVLTTPLQVQCSKEAVSNWDSITNYFYGVAGTGFTGREEWIGLCKAKYQWGGPWKPLDGYKHTLCGYLAIKKNKRGEGNNAYHLISDGDGDLVLYVIPDPAFRWLQFKSLRPQGHYFKDFSLSCEVSLREPGNTIATDAATYFQNISFDSILYKPVGVYGPWVSDVHHDNSPEIHPVQQIWRTEQRHDTLEYQLFSLFDNSSRFTNQKDFPDSCFKKPWMPVPLVNVFYIPFAISLKDSGQFIYDITIASSNNINEYPPSGEQLRLMINDKIKLTVKRPGNSFPKVTFMDVCQVDDNTIHGYLAIETSIAKDNIKSGAHAILKMIRSKNSTVQ